MKGKEEKMRNALTFFRGKDFDITQDEKDIDDYIKNGQVMHIVQQLSGINAVMFYASSIFVEGDFFNLNNHVCVVILGAFQIFAVGIAVGVVDKVGRRILWLISLGIMAVCLTITAIYFFIDTDIASKIQFILVICICLYVLGFCLGTGPLPWAMMGEMLSAAAKSYTGPIVAAINWLLAYVVTVSYPYLKESVVFVLIETKDKTLDEIQTALGNK
ncbi:Sugar transporter [Popillia japonica]|uniref:Sugar transporter n=1 Tax=Popillia japonica TaxID=7064 RepID=A0AAW1J110_POPJA